MCEKLYEMLCRYNLNGSQKRSNVKWTEPVNSMLMNVFSRI